MVQKHKTRVRFSAQDYGVYNNGCTGGGLAGGVNGPGR